MTAIHVSRNGKTLGIYPEPDARDYYAQGRIAPHDLVWREGMAGWVAASELFGPAPQAAAEPIAPPVPPPMPAALSARQVPTFETNAPLPPKLHWALVLLFTLLTFGLFVIVWLFIQAAWVKKIDPRSRALTMMAIYLALVVVGQAISAASEKESAEAAAGGMLVLIGSVVAVVGMFSMRRSMIDYYNSVEPIGLKLSAALTFFFGLFYLQYHMTRIAKWKQGGVLPLQ